MFIRGRRLLEGDTYFNMSINGAVLIKNWRLFKACLAII